MKAIFFIGVSAGLALVGAAIGLRTLHAEPGRSTLFPAPATQPATQPGPAFVGERAGDWESYQALHAYILDRFVKSEGFGLRRVIRIQDQPRFKLLYADGTRYSVGRVELISLNDGKDPFAYVTHGDDAMKNQLKTATHRPLDQTESDALAEIRQGKEVVLTGSGEGRELIGAVRAAAECAKCHAVAEGTLLGAFRYPLVLARVDR